VKIEINDGKAGRVNAQGRECGLAEIGATLSELKSPLLVQRAFPGKGGVHKGSRWEAKCKVRDGLAAKPGLIGGQNSRVQM